MLFSDIVGHREEKELLRSMVDSDRIPHALLLSGISGIGKMKMARVFAQYIHCQYRTGGEPCGRCPSCLRHQSFNSTDLYFIFPIVKKGKEKNAISSSFYDQWREFITTYPYMEVERWQEILGAGNSQPSIMVSESQEILRIASLSPFSEDRKIFIVWLPEKMNSETANKLLKVVEEPFDDTNFIFVSNNPEKLLPTVFSRLYRINLHRLSDKDIFESLLRKGLPEDKCREITGLCEGSIGKAMELAENGGEEHEFNLLFIDMMRMAYSRNIVRIKEISDNISDFGREKIKRFLEYSGRMIRENYIYNFRLGNLNVMNEEQESFSRKFSPFINSANVERISNEIGKAAEDIMRNANAKVVLFNLMLIFMIELRKNN